VPSPRTRAALRAAAGVVVVPSTAAVAAGLLLRQTASGSGRSLLPASLPLARVSSFHGLLPAPGPARLGPEGVPVPADTPLARAGAPAPGSTVDGISGTAGEQLAFHIAFFDGRSYLGNPRDIPLLAQAQIQLDVGRPLVAPETIDFSQGV
jgi:hypothetical protein